MMMSSVATDLTPAEYGELGLLWCAFEKGREKLGFAGMDRRAAAEMIVDAGFRSFWSQYERHSVVSPTNGRAAR